MTLPLASDVFGWDEEDVNPPAPSPAPVMPPGPCDRCPHEEHIGPCEMERQVQGVTMVCQCFSAARMVTDPRRLRLQDAAQQRRAELLKGRH